MSAKSEMANTAKRMYSCSLTLHEIQYSTVSTVKARVQRRGRGVVSDPEEPPDEIQRTQPNPTQAKPSDERRTPGPSPVTPQG